MGMYILCHVSTHLLDREELEKILGKIRREIEDLKKAVEDKDADLEDLQKLPECG